MSDKSRQDNVANYYNNVDEFSLQFDYSVVDSACLNAREERLQHCIRRY